MLEYSGVGLAAETRWDVLYKETAMTLFFYLNNSVTAAGLQWAL